MPTVEYIDPLTMSPYTVPPYAVVSNVSRDTGSVKDDFPARARFNLSGAGGELRFPSYSTPPSISWCGFYWRLDTEPGPGGTNILTTVCGAGSQGRISYDEVGNVIYHFLSAGGGSANVSYPTPGTWVWIEQILNRSANPSRINTRVNGTDLTDTTFAEAASTITYHSFNPNATSGDTSYALFLAGRAVSDSDWLGESAAREFHPMRGLVIPDLTSATSASKTFTLPYELVGVGEPNVLGNVLTTQAVPVVFEEARAPLASDDLDSGYSVGDIWIDTALLAAYWCVSNASNAAIWKKVTS